jgi:hypothetical protein
MGPVLTGSAARPVTFNFHPYDLNAADGHATEHVTAL